MESIWDLPISRNPDLERALEIEFNLSPVICKILVNIGIKSVREAQEFLNPAIGNFTDPFILKDMDLAAKRAGQAIMTGEKILLYGDYDADGITSISAVYHFFRSIQSDCAYYIPNRLREGYGLNPQAVSEIVAKGYRLVITLDCGISNIEEIKTLRNNGIDTIVIDHHTVPPEIPEALAIVDPKQADCASEFKEYAAAGLSLKFLMAVRKELRQHDWFKEKEPNLKELLDLVALGTVGDVVPLRAENRVITKLGIDQLNTTERPGILALKKVCGVKEPIKDTFALSFGVVPRINAVGRLGEASRGVELLTTSDPALAGVIAQEMNAANISRKKIEETIYREAKELIESSALLQNRNTFVLLGKDWHLGVIGIVASKLAEEYGKPTILLTGYHDHLKGSARSIPDFNIIAAIVALKDSLVAYGGHAKAAGLTLCPENLADFSARFEAYFGAQGVLPQKKISVQALLPFEAITKDLILQLETLAPFGEGNPRPLFGCEAVSVASFRILGERHVKLKLSHQGNSMEGLFFNGVKKFSQVKLSQLKIAFYPELETYNGLERIYLNIRWIE